MKLHKHGLFFIFLNLLKIRTGANLYKEPLFHKIHLYRPTPYKFCKSENKRNAPFSCTPEMTSLVSTGIVTSRAQLGECWEVLEHHSGSKR